MFSSQHYPYVVEAANGGSPHIVHGYGGPEQAAREAKGTKLQRSFSCDRRDDDYYREAGT